MCLITSIRKIFRSSKEFHYKLVDSIINQHIYFVKFWDDEKRKYIDLIEIYEDFNPFGSRLTTNYEYYTRNHRFMNFSGSYEHHLKLVEKIKTIDDVYRYNENIINELNILINDRLENERKFVEKRNNSIKKFKIK